MGNHARHCLLVGGGHAHVAVLADWIRRGIPGERATLVTPSPRLRYSGMVPGWIAGRYDRTDGTVDLAALADSAGVQLMLARCTGIDPDGRIIETDDGQRIAFDIASIDTGGIGRARDVLGDDARILDVRPIDRFVGKLDHALESLDDRPISIAVTGGGAGGVELAFALRHAAAVVDAAAATGRAPRVLMVTGSAGLLPGFAASVRRRVEATMQAQDIRIVEGDARLVEGALHAGGSSLEPVDLIVAALGSGAPDWPRAGGLACDDDGFIAVDAHQCSLSHPHIFAVGDVAVRADRDVPHSGVHAVFSGPVLAHNLRDAMAGRPPGRSYRPRWNNLYLLSTGGASIQDAAAIASYGPFAAQGRWVGRLKHWIDKRWISKYAKLAKG